MAMALLPIFVLSLIQTQADFRRQAEDRQVDLQLAAERSASDAKAQLDSAQVLLRALSPDAAGPYCAARLTALVGRLDGYEGLYRISPTGEATCASGRPDGLRSGVSPASNARWFQRLRDGEDLVVMRAPDDAGYRAALIVATRAERPMGRFDGAMVAVIPLSALQPDLEDPALPSGSQAALTDGAGRILTASDAGVFRLSGGDKLAGWVSRARNEGSAVFQARDAGGEQRDYAGAALAGGDLYALLSAPSQGWLSWARLNPIGTLLLPLGAWLTAFAAVMLLSERIFIRWLDYLERVAAIYTRGRFSVRPLQAMNAPAEIRTMAKTLDEMAEAITVRDRELTDALAEKDALMREIHHRVKNNLQIISSLLSMQQRALTDAPAKAALGDTRQRISALALIYRTLYQSDDIRHADAREFLNELVGQLIASEAGRGPVVISSVDADSLHVDPDKLAPLALWLVEAVTNAQKHAFALNGGELKVRFRVQGDTSVLEVEDNGPGAPAGAEVGVGRTLMSAFAKQLRGETDFVTPPGGGTIARMTFATPEALIPADPADKSSVARGTGGMGSR
ncbi:putative sensor histidine kinase pdtaS [Brevundimonas sp. SH203]|uniref:sensor histidine kinase PhyK n=1 Tax=Brevundimonas sp. SH203 TaxID=345167 RepID=UPI0009CC19A1|nr:sensor histidine kinase [Brevundimonas sp. SH203]GAW41656.1 putative sensor histidine kinase pdtaS [Brevundimonas sp. SH203]